MNITLFKWIIRLLPLFYIGLVWMQSSLFNPSADNVTPGLGYLFEMGHLILFGIFYVLMILALMTYGEVTPRKEATVLILAILCALGDEIHQHYVPFRSASLIDLLKDGIGIMASWFLVRLYMRFKRLPK